MYKTELIESKWSNNQTQILFEKLISQAVGNRQPEKIWNIIKFR